MPTFDEQKHAAEAVIERVHSHTVMLAGYPPYFLGTAIALCFAGQYLFLTAEHVVKDVPDSELQFSPKHCASLNVNEPSRNRFQNRTFKLTPLGVIRRFSDASVDIAGLVISREHCSGTELRFYDLESSPMLSRTIPTNLVTCGYPQDGGKRIGPAAWSYSPHVLFTKPVAYKRQFLEGFKPRTNFLMNFAPGSDGRDARGFSGSGVWHVTRSQNASVWSPRISLRGMIVHHYKSSHLLSVVRVARVASFLKSKLGRVA